MKNTDVSRRVGHNLRVYRADRGFQQEDIAVRMASPHPTWKRTTVSQIERGHRAVTVDELLDLAVILEVEMVDLLREGRL